MPDQNKTFSRLGQHRAANALFEPTIDRIVRYLGDGISVHIIGPRCSGRSALLAEVGNRVVASEHGLVTVHGTSPWRAEPLAALVGANLFADPSQRSLGAAISALSRAISARTSVLACDDADFLDPASVGVLLTVLREHQAVAVTTSLDQRRIDQDSLMWGLSPAVSVYVDTVDIDQLQELVVQTIGAPMDPASLSTLALKSGGLFGLAHALLTVGTQQHAITRSATGVFTLAGPLWSRDLTWIAEHLLAGTNNDVREAATVLAAIGPAPVLDAEAAIGKKRLDALLSKGLAHYAGFEYGRIVGIFPPLLSDYLNATPTPFRAPGLAGPEAVGVSLDLTARISTMDTALMAQQSLQEAAIAARTHRAVWEADPTPQNALPLLVALENTSAPDIDVEQVIDNTPVIGDEPSVPLFLLWCAIWYAARDDGVVKALATLESSRKAMPRYDAFLRACQAHVMFTTGRAPTPDLLEPPAKGEDSLCQEALDSVRIEMAIAAGNTDDALAMLEHYRPTRMTFIQHKQMLHDLATILSGDIETGVASALIHLDQARRTTSSSAVETFGYVSLLGLTISGRLSDGSALLQNLLAISPSATFRHVYHSGTLALGALIAFWSGKSAYAKALAAQASTASPLPGPFPAMDPVMVSAIVQANGNAQIAPELWDIASQRLDQGFVAAGFVASLLAAAHGPDTAGVIDRVRAMTPPQSCFLEDLRQYAVAAAGLDVDGLEKLVAQLHDVGAHLSATTAAISLAMLLRQQGRRDEATIVAEQTWRQTTGRDSAGLFSRLSSDVGLSSREQEIMALIADGLTYPEIAAVLDVSARTVETHLQNISKKVGVAGRERLGRAARTWLRATPE